MNEFVTLCARDKTPVIWLQDTTGIDVGDDAEKAELLGLGQSLIYLSRMLSFRLLRLLFVRQVLLLTTFWVVRRATTPTYSLSVQVLASTT